MTDIFGTGGADTLTGTDQPDTINSLGGSDTVDGGAGDDTITDTGGSHNVLKGGAGNDTIRLTDRVGGGEIWSDVAVNDVIQGGTGDDSVYLSIQRKGSLSVDLGDGNDILVLGSNDGTYLVGQTSVTMGPGQDHLVLSYGFGDLLRLGGIPVTVSDFQAGNGGDVVDIGGAVQGFFGNPSPGEALPGANPFVGGFVVLIQDGADTIVRIDYDGAGHSPAREANTLVRLVGVTASQLTAANFGGLDPSGAAPVALTINGTTGNDHLMAATTGGQVNGLGGDDVLLGSIGNSTLDGGDGNDTIVGGRGNDHLIGGDGNDTLSDNHGSDILDGGAGDDTISWAPISNPVYNVSTTDHIAINAGDGNDIVNLDDPRSVVLNGSGRHLVDATVDLGAGNDRINIGGGVVHTTVTLGAGQDHVVLGDQFFLNSDDGTNNLVAPARITITDFQAGDNGDWLDFAGMFSPDSWPAGTNPFATGNLRLQQQGTDVIISSDDDGVNGSDTLQQMIRLSNVSIGSLTAYNLGGFAPDGSALVGMTRTGGAGADTLDGSDGNDHLTGGDGNDRLDGSFGNDTLDGGIGDDWLSGGAGNDTLIGGEGNDTIVDLGNGSDTINGGEGNDTIRVDHGYNLASEITAINAGGGDDQVYFAATKGGSTSIDLGGGNDHLTLGSTSDNGLVITLGTGSDIVSFDPVIDSQSLSPITITDFATGDGGDRLDLLQLVQDKLHITGEPDTFNPFAAGNARLVQSGADTLLQFGDNFGFQTLIDFQNRTLASFTNFNLGITFSATNGTAGADTITGTTGSDLIFGFGGNDHIDGLGSDDTLDGGAGVDTVSGGDGNDFINDTDGLDLITGGDGNDTITVNATAGASTAGFTDAGAGDDRLDVTLATNQSVYVASMGSGNDLVNVTENTAGEITLTLGTGTDTVELNAASAFYGGIVRITDFQAGNGGDVFDLNTYMNGKDGAWEQQAQADRPNPFAQGLLQLVQSGSEVQLLYYDTGVISPTGYEIAAFQNTTIAQFTAANFGGYDPHVTASSPVILTSDLTIAAGETQTSHNPYRYNSYAIHYVYEMSGSAGQFVNNGTANTVVDTPARTIGFYFDPAAGGSAGREFHNTATGHFIVSSTWVDISGDVTAGATFGYFAQGNSMPIVNDGEFKVEAASGTAWGFETGYDYGLQGVTTITNHGTITVTSAYDAIGAQLGSYGSFNNSGTMTVHGGDFAVGLYLFDYQTEPVVNSGTITISTDPNSPYASVGILADQALAFNFTNSGTLTADIAIDVLTGSNSGPFANHITNTGTIDGALILDTGGDTVTNSGTMYGRTMLGADDDVYNGVGGTHHGTIEGGSGNDSLTGGNGAETFFGDSDNDLIVAGGGDDFVDGGTGSDLLDGGSGVDMLSYIDSLGGVTIDLELGTATTSTEFDWVRNFEQVVGSRTDDTIRGSGQDEVLLGFLGDDVLDGRGGDDTLVGGKGHDILTGGAGANVFVFEAGDDNDEITDFSVDDAITVYGYAGYQSLQQVGSDVRITFSASDSILVHNSTVAALGGAHLTFSTGPSGVYIPNYTDETIVADSNLVVAQGLSLAFGDANPLRTNDAAAPITAVAIAEPHGIPDPSVGIWNSGSISLVTATPNPEASIGIYHQHQGSGQRFVNSATGSLTVSADGADAVGTYHISSIWNAGAITVTSSTGDATAFDQVYSIDTHFVNSGTISVTAAGKAQGLVQGNDSSLGLSDYFNSGSITVHGGTQSVGLSMLDSGNIYNTDPSHFVNSGTITVTDDTAAIDSIGVEIALYQSVQFWNSGTISADFAFRLVRADSGAGFAGVGLKLYNSGTINGAVNTSSFDDQLVNTGHLSGDVWLGGGNDLFDGRQAQSSTGTIDGYDGNDTILTGDGVQTLIGGFGNDILSGGGGNDLLTGGAGADSFRFGTGFNADTISDFSAAEGDRIDVSGYTSYQSIAQNGSDVLVTFSAGDTLLVRGAQVSQVTAAVHFGVAAIGANAIPVAPSAPNAPAPPTVWEDNGFFFHETGTPGADTLIGGAGPDDMAGLAGNDTLIGGTGNDHLDGGTGADSLYGGVGDDLYYADRADDLVFENAGEGTDTVIASAGYYLYANIENLTLAAGAGDIFGVGNELANTITGNEGSNLLIAGAGADVVHGGAGVDSLFGQDGNDQLFGDAGIDYLVGGTGDDVLDGGTQADALYGEDGNDTLIGGSDFQTDILVGGNGDDILHGDSGLGDYDLMDGGAGNDTYYVDTPADLTFEAAGGGTDTVIANIQGAGYYLYANVENLILQGNTPYGVGNELDNHLTGSSASNWLLGGAGNDVLNGKAGNDVLFGEAGADTFVFEQGTGGDVIGDFTAGTDKIDLSAFGFASFQAVVNSMHEAGGTTAIDLGGGDFIVINGVAEASLHQGDFILSGGSSAQAPLSEQIVAKVSDAPDEAHNWRAGLVHQFDDPHAYLAVAM